MVRRESDGNIMYREGVCWGSDEVKVVWRESDEDIMFWGGV